jgi:predicted adenylyl cyclase CyaB
MEAEVELKYEIRELKLIEKFLSDGEVKSTKNSVDKYYDNKDFSFFKQGIFIRVRDDKKLDFKYNFEDDKHEYCQENRFELPIRMDKSDIFNNLLKTLGLKPLGDDVSLTTFLELNNLIDFVIIDKTRTEISKDELNFYLDNVKEVGEFIEIEGIPKQSSDIEDMIANIKGIAKKLNLKKLTTGYVELYLRKYNYNIYAQGKYLLEEDTILHKGR